MKPWLDLPLAPTPRDTVERMGASRLLRFSDGRPAEGPAVLLVPSLINRWYVLDLRPGASMVEALVAAGFAVYCYDWGTGHDEDRFITWDDIVARLARAVRWTRRHSGCQRIGLLGYSMGATLAAITTALAPSHIGALANLAGPIDFRHAGTSRRLVDARWFDLDALTAAGNVSSAQIRAGLVALRPTVWASKAAEFAAVAHEPGAQLAFACLEAWVNDNVAFPAAVYRRYIAALYRDNELVRGLHRVAGQTVDLQRITCPTLVVTARRDEICPPAAAIALREHVGTRDTTTLSLDGGHVGAVVGHQAHDELYPALTHWFDSKLTS